MTTKLNVSPKPLNQLLDAIECLGQDVSFSSMANGFLKTVNSHFEKTGECIEKKMNNYKNDYETIKSLLLQLENFKQEFPRLVRASKITKVFSVDTTDEKSMVNDQNDMPDSVVFRARANMSGQIPSYSEALNRHFPEYQKGI